MSPDRAIICGWMDAAASGDDAAFGRLAGAVQDDLYRFGLANGLRCEDAAEAVQETLLRAYRVRRRWRTGGDAMTWLYGICMNVVREARRRRRGDPVQGLDLGGFAGGQDAAGGSGDMSDLLAAIDRLPARQREALVCRYLRRMSVRDTAAAMGCAEGTIKAAVAAALENLRRQALLRDLRTEYLGP
jgi:RNA polymerase sigma factor (sigma-70 family)